MVPHLALLTLAYTARGHCLTPTDRVGRIVQTTRQAYRVGGDKSTCLGLVVAVAVVVQPCLGIKILPLKTQGGGDLCELFPPHIAIGTIAHLPSSDPTLTSLYSGLDTDRFIDQGAVSCFKKVRIPIFFPLRTSQNCGCTQNLTDSFNCTSHIIQNYSKP
jgi:hypothetical protein